MKFTSLQYYESKYIRYLNFSAMLDSDTNNILMATHGTNL